jgi:hypothetical protein
MPGQKYGKRRHKGKARAPVDRLFACAGPSIIRAIAYLRLARNKKRGYALRMLRNNIEGRA